MNASKFADTVARRLHGLINKERQKRDLDPLRGRKPLIEAATDHSKVMAQKNQIFHNGPDGSPQHRSPAGYSGIAENCAMHHERGSTGKAAHKLKDQWMNSKAHRKNLLDSRNKYDGLGIWVRGGKVYATHMMARRGAVRGMFGSQVSTLGNLIQKPTQWVTPPYSLRERQILYGGLYGGLGFVTAAIETTLDNTTIPPTDISGTLSYYFTIRTAAFEQAGTNWEQWLGYLLDSSTVVLTLVAVLCGVSISGSSRLRHIIVNTATAGVGFVIMAAAMAWLFADGVNVQSLSAIGMTAAAGCSLATFGYYIARNSHR